MSGKNEELIRKFKPMSKEDVAAAIKKQEDAKKQYATDNVTLESELEAFNKTEDPLINPATGKAMCWVRRPSQAEWESLIDKDMAAYTDHPENMPPELAQKHNDALFQLMAKIISKPNHDAKWWKEHSNLIFIQLFNMHLTQVMKDLGIMAGNF